MVSLSLRAEGNLLVAKAIAHAYTRLNTVQKFGIGRRRCSRRGNRWQTPARARKRRSVEDIFKCLGPIYFRRAYRMSYESFLELHSKLKVGIEQVMATTTALKKKRLVEEAGGATTTPKLKKGNHQPKKGSPNYKLPPVTNGSIATSIRLACTLRYLAGGSPLDLMVQYGISHTEVHNSVWYVIEAINRLTEFHISYPSNAAEQKRIAAEFEEASGVNFKNCAGAIDGILIWIEKPTMKDATNSGIGMKKLFCGRKSKFGLNCQAVADKQGRFLDISIKYGGSSADCLAFEASDLFSRLEDGLLSPGLVLFGDNAYLNSSFMATPYPNVSGGSRDNYNYYHSQVRKIEVEGTA